MEDDNVEELFTNPDGTVTHFWHGRKGCIPDSTWRVLSLEHDEFIEIGTVTVNGEHVREEMITHRSIKDFEPQDIAESEARKKFPNAKVIVIERIWS